MLRDYDFASFYNGFDRITVTGATQTWRRRDARLESVRVSLRRLMRLHSAVHRIDHGLRRLLQHVVRRIIDAANGDCPERIF